MDITLAVEQADNVQYAFLGFLAPAIKFLGTKALPWIGKKAIPWLGKQLGFSKASGGGLLKGLGNTLGIAQGIGGLNAGGKEFGMNKQLMMQQFKLNKEMYDYQNAYNTPAMQMQRLKDAGLNPALMYGQGTTGNASGFPQAQTVAPYQHRPTDFQPLLSSIATTSQSNLQDVTAIGQGIDNARKTKTFKDDVLYAEANRQLAQAQKNKVLQEKLNLIAERNRIKNDAELKGIQAEIQKIDRDFFRNYDLAPSDFGIYKGLKRLGATIPQIIEYLLSGDMEGLEDIIMGNDHRQNRINIEGQRVKNKLK